MTVSTGVYRIWVTEKISSQSVIAQKYTQSIFIFRTEEGKKQHPCFGPVGSKRVLLAFISLFFAHNLHCIVLFHCYSDGFQVTFARPVERERDDTSENTSAERVFRFKAKAYSGSI